MEEEAVQPESVSPDEKTGAEVDSSDSSPDDGAEARPEKKVSTSVPYSRFSEVNNKWKQEKAEAERLRKQIEELSARPQVTEEVFDAETAANLQKWAKQQGFISQAEAQELERRLQRAEGDLGETRREATLERIRRNVPGFKENEDAVLNLFAKLNDEGFAGEEMTKVLLTHVLADSGQLTSREGVEHNQEMRAAAGGPTGISGGKVKEPSAIDEAINAGAGSEKFAALMDAVKQGRVPS